MSRGRHRRDDFRRERIAVQVVAAFLAAVAVVAVVRGEPQIVREAAAKPSAAPSHTPAVAVQPMVGPPAVATVRATEYGHARPVRTVHAPATATHRTRPQPQPAKPTAVPPRPARSAAPAPTTKAPKPSRTPSPTPSTRTRETRTEPGPSLLGLVRVVIR